MGVRFSLEPSSIAQLVEHPFSKREVMRSKLIGRKGCYAPAGKLVSLDLNKSLKGSSDFGAVVFSLERNGL